MTTERRKYKESIRVRYLSTVIYVFLAMIATSVIYYAYMEKVQEELADEGKEYKDRYSLVEDIDTTLHELVLRGRGYVAFDSGAEKLMMDQALVKLEHQIDEFKALDLDAQDEEFISRLAIFYETYRYDILEPTIKSMKAGDMKKVEAIHKGSAGNIINDELQQTSKFKNEYHKHIHELESERLERSRRDAIIASGLSALFLLLLLPLVGMIINRIIRPIEQLDHAANEIARGNFAKLPERKEDDEIGRLTDSFREMIHVVRSKEEDLMSHNEELVAQQGELEEQQMKVEESLVQLERANGVLERMNKLNHHLTFTLDKQELCHIFHGFLNGQFACDRSIFWFREEKIHASNNITPDIIEGLVETGVHVDLLRLHQESSYVVRRKTTAWETGFADKPFDAYDVYCGVRNAGDEVVAVFAATRLGMPFTDEEIEQLEGLMNRMGLAIGRIYLYEDVEMARQLNMDMVQNINEGVQLIDMDGNMLQGNETLHKYLNSSILDYDWNVREHLSYGKWTDIFLSQCDDPGGLAAYFKAAVDYPEMEDKSFQYTVGERYMEVYATPVYRAGKRISTLLVHRDITREYEIDRMKSELVSTVSHELRTPLSSVLGFTELLLTKELKTERRRKYLETIHKEAKRLTNLINDFLDIQRMEAGKQAYKRENVRMDELAMNVLDRFSADAMHKVSVVDEAPYTTVEGDADRLEQVLTNLVGNAIKFAPDGGDVEIRLCNEAGRLLVHVSDEGMGIPADEIDKLFAKFQRVDNSEQRKVGGTGLGLAICREIIEHHGGNIWLESKEGEGTTASFSLPLNAEDIDPEFTGKGQGGAGSIMIVEDDTSTALLLSEELKSKGFTVIHHYKPIHAYEDALKTPLLGIIVDLTLGDDVGGWDLIGMLKENEKTKDVPIIVSSALDFDEQKSKFYQIEKYLTKPYDPKQLVETLNAFMQSKQMPGEILFPKE